MGAWDEYLPEPEEHPWHEKWPGEDPGHQDARRARYVSQVATRHGVPGAQAKKAIGQVARDLQRNTSFADTRDYGFQNSPGHLGDRFFTAKMIHHLNRPETWEGSRVEQVPTDDLHASQNWLRPRTMAHNLFHPGKREPASEHEAGHPDIDPEEDRGWDDEEDEGSDPGFDSLAGVTRFVRRSSDGRLQVADGHHRVAADLLLGKATTPGRVIDEDDLKRRAAGDGQPPPSSSRDLWQHLREDHEIASSDLPGKRPEDYHDLASEHDHSHEFDGVYLDHEHEEREPGGEQHTAAAGPDGEGSLYHGTPRALAPGDLIESGHDRAMDSHLPGPSEHVFATTSPAWARDLAKRVTDHPAQPHVYQVEPTGEHEPDTYDTVPGRSVKSRQPFRVMRELDGDELGGDWRWQQREAAARYQPSSGIFGPTTGLDSRLFGDDGELRGAVAEAIMERLDTCIRTDAQVAGSEWQKWARVYLAGGSASEWAGSRPNDAAQDLDVLVGVDYDKARHETDSLKPLSDDQITAALNAAFRGCFNGSGVTLPGVEGTWDVTAYCNPAAWDITAIRPYAAWDVSDGRWAVRPPHLPEHSLADFDPAVLAQARAVLAEARAVLRMPEPLRTREARALWERIHAERSVAFSQDGGGWEDPGNVAEKMTAYAPGNVLVKIRELALSKTAASEGDDARTPEQHRSDQLAAMDPNQRASKLAQEEVRDWHPRTTLRLYEKNGQRNHSMATWLGEAGVPKADESYVAVHPKPALRQSMTGRGPDGEPVAVLHPEQWDYGTLAHETAHIIDDHETGRLFRGAPGPHGSHNDNWAGHYARLLNQISRSAGDEFLEKRSRYLDEGSDEAKSARARYADDFGQDLGHREAAAENPPCHYCGEPLDDEDVDNEASSHDECEQMRWCEAHQEHHDDPMDAEHHNDTYTDWGGHLPFEGGIHRGFPLQLPPEVHDRVHDAARPAVERAGILRDHLDANPSDGMGLQRRLTDEERYGEKGHFGVHWTDQEEHARGWGADDYTTGPVGAGPKPSVTHVVLHAASPEPEHVEEDPDELERRHMYGFDHPRSEHEVPLKVGAPVRLTGISWKRGGEDEWNRHDFPGGSQHTASSRDEDDEDDDDDGGWKEENGATDAYVTCDQGHQHWGTAGAAGLLIRHRGDDGQYRYLLQHRSPYVQHGNTWSTPGGALQRGESPEEGALREAREEFGELPKGVTHHHTWTDDHGGWKYHTVVMDAPRQFTPGGGDEDSDWESSGHGWFTPKQVKALPLHPGFAASWDGVRKSGAVQKAKSLGYDPAEELPEGRGIWYRAHDMRYPLDEAHARSAPLNHGYRPFQKDPLWSVGQRGYSSFASPHELSRYIDDMDWKEGDSWPHRKAIAFHGKQAGVGEDNEPLVVPEASPHCCGRVIHAQMPWNHFEGKLWSGDYADEESHKYHNPQELWRENNQDHELSERRLRHTYWQPPEVRSERRHQEKEERRQQQREAAADPGQGIPSFTWRYETYAPEGGYVAREQEVSGPFYHGSRSKRLREGDQVTIGRKTNPWGDEGAKSQWAHFTTDLGIARQYANDAGGHVYEVEPTGEVHGGYIGAEWKSKAPLRVRRRVMPDQEALGQREAAAEPEPDFAVHAGKYAISYKPGSYSMVEAHGHDKGRPAGNWVGWLSHDDGGTVGNVRVREEHQRQGLATAMLQYAQAQNPDLTFEHSRNQTGEGAAWAQARPLGQREAASEHDGPWYHGTHQDLSPDDLVSPGRQANWASSDSSRVYLTRSEDQARKFAADAAYKNRTFDLGHVYEVEPTGGVEEDPSVTVPGAPVQSYKSASPLRVVRKVAVSGYEGITGRTGMIYINLPEGAVRHVPGGVDDHHITLVYLGKGITDKAFAEACRRAKEAAADCPPLEGVLRGVDTFPADDGKVPAFVPAYIPGIGRLRQALEDLSASEHRHFRPHVTLGYLDEDEELPGPHPAVPVSFTRLHVKRGDEIVSYPLGGEAMAKEAAVERDWGPGTTVRMVPPEEYAKFEYPDYPRARTPVTLAKHLRKKYPDYYQALHDDIAANGVQAPVLVRYRQGSTGEGRLLGRPQVMDGHHRAAVAYDLGIHIPVGDYDSEADYDASLPSRQSWFRDHWEQKEQGEPPWRRHEAAAGPVVYYHGSGKRYADGDLIDPAQPHERVHKQSDPAKVYFSDNAWNAQNWADVAARSGKGHVYEVEPTGPHEEDPHYSGPEENGIYDLSASPVKRINVYQTGHPLRVIRRIPREGS